ncbi:MAG: hypothetical protein NZ585_06390 [Chloracidobacterium sp.]|nr:hypothetical protein [Chloracidobacterium sp.]MDW8216070.1 hypothetical protein [Acidobacteriota bacterium]
MDTYTGYHRYMWLLIGLLCLATPALGQSPSAVAQKATAGLQTPPDRQGDKPPQGPPADTIPTTYTGTGRDPFRRPSSDPFRDSGKLREPFRPPVTDLPYPDFPTREAKWREIRDRRLDQGQPPPAESEKYLVEELTVIGIYSTERGLGALLKERRSGTTMFVREGSKFWNGSVKKIERAPRTFGVADAQVVGRVVCSEIIVRSNGQLVEKQRFLDYIPKAASGGAPTAAQ